MPTGFNPKRSIGWIFLLLLGLLFVWASLTGALADIVAAFIAPSFLEKVD